MLPEATAPRALTSKRPDWVELAVGVVKEIVGVPFCTRIVLVTVGLMLPVESIMFRESSRPPSAQEDPSTIHLNSPDLFMDDEVW